MIMMMMTTTHPEGSFRQFLLVRESFSSENLDLKGWAVKTEGLTNLLL
jgi:hypothetical protein